MKEKRLVVTSCMTEVGHRYGEVTIPLMQAYARKCGADFHVNYIPHPAYAYLGYQKWEYLYLLKAYDRVLHIDIDMIVRSNTPNLFDIVPPGSFGAVNELPFQDLAVENPPVDRNKDVNVPALRFYVNVGLYLFDYASASVFFTICPRDPHPFFREQSEINEKLHDVGQAVALLPHEFNYMKIMENAGLNKDDAYIVHYAGSYGGLTTDQVIEQMKKDIR